MSDPIQPAPTLRPQITIDQYGGVGLAGQIGPAVEREYAERERRRQAMMNQPIQQDHRCSICGATACLHLDVSARRQDRERDTAAMENELARRLREGMNEFIGRPMTQQTAVEMEQRMRDIQNSMNVRPDIFSAYNAAQRRPEQEYLTAEQHRALMDSANAGTQAIRSRMRESGFARSILDSQPVEEPAPVAPRKPRTFLDPMEVERVMEV